MYSCTTLYPVAMLLLGKYMPYCTNRNHIALTASALQARVLPRIKEPVDPVVNL